MAHNVPFSICTYTFRVWSLAFNPHRTSSLRLSASLFSLRYFKRSIGVLTIISAIRNRDKLFVCSLKWEPGFQVVFLCRSQVECTRDDVDDPIAQPKTLVEPFTVREHRFHHLPALARFSDHELFHFFKLMDTENAPHVAPCRTSFFSKACRVACIFYGKLCLGILEPFVGMEGRDRLFRGRNKVFLVIGSNNLPS